ncbi:hypothetical protein ACIBL3_36550 [Kribbella sp. NPDC050124]
MRRAVVAVAADLGDDRQRVARGGLLPELNRSGTADVWVVSITDFEGTPS